MCKHCVVKISKQMLEDQLNNKCSQSGWHLFNVTDYVDISSLPTVRFSQCINLTTRMCDFVLNDVDYVVILLALYFSLRSCISWLCGHWKHLQSIRSIIMRHKTITTSIIIIIIVFIMGLRSNTSIHPSNSFCHHVCILKYTRISTSVWTLFQF